MPHNGCTLEYWAKCLQQTQASTYCRARGGELHSYIDGAGLAAFNSFVSRQSNATRQASLACGGQGARWPDLSAIVWTGLRSQSGNSTCGTSCTWQVRPWLALAGGSQAPAGMARVS